MRYVKIAISVLLLIVSFFIFFQDDFKHLTDEQYTNDIDWIQNRYSTNSDLRHENMDEYLEKIVVVDGKIFKMTNNATEGIFFILGSSLLLIYTIEDFMKKRKLEQNKTY